MISLVLNESKKDEGKLILKLSPGFRILFFAIALFLLFFLGTESKEFFSQANTGLLIIIIICLLSASYKDKWIFDRNKRYVEHRFGLLFLFSRRFTSLEDVQYIAMAEYVRGRRNVSSGKGSPFQPAYTTLALIKRDGGTKNVEISKSRNKLALENKGKKIAEFCSLPFFGLTPD